MSSPSSVFTRPVKKPDDLAVPRLPGVSFDAPDFLLVRARDLKHVLQALDAALHLRADGRSAWASRAFHTERTAIGQLRNISNSSKSLQDFLSSLVLSSSVSACGARMPGVAACAAAGVPGFVTPPSNTGVNKILSLAQVAKEKQVSA